MWDEPQAFSGAYNPNMVFAKRGLVISERTEGKGRLRLLDYATGRSMWGKKGKGLKIKGGIVDHAVSGSNLVITTGYDSAWTDAGTEYLLYVVDLVSGELRSKKPLKVRGRLQYTMSIDKGVLYVTSHEANVIDPVSVTRLNDNVLVSKHPLVTTLESDAMFSYSNGTGLVHRLDLKTGRIEPFSRQKVKLQGKDEPDAIERRVSGIVVVGRQNVIGWNERGELEFEQYHPAPKKHVVLQALLYAQAARSAAAAFASGVYAVEFARASNRLDTGTLGREITDGFSDGYAQLNQGYAGMAADYFRAARARFQASTDSRDFVFMMVRQEKRRIGLAQVSKTDGAIVGAIDLGRDKEPSYQVDDIGNVVFYRRDPKELQAFQF